MVDGGEGAARIAVAVGQHTAQHVDRILGTECRDLVEVHSLSVDIAGSTHPVTRIAPSTQTAVC